MPESTPAASPSRVLVEACVDSVEGAIAAVAAGAHRIELCGPGEGGTTPAPAVMRACRAAIDVPVHVMVRPHTRNFCYDDDDLATMLDAIVQAKQAGMDGVVFGALLRSGRLADSEMSMLVGAAKPLQVVCHRAFDVTPDADAALDTLLALGVDGVLTAGHAANALEGADRLRALQQRAGSRLTVMAGGGVRSQNVRQIVERSGVAAVHARATDVAVFAAVVAELQS